MNARYALAVLAVRALRHAVVSAFVGALLKQLAVDVSAPGPYEGTQAASNNVPRIERRLNMFPLSQA